MLFIISLLKDETVITSSDSKSIQMKEKGKSIDPVSLIMTKNDWIDWDYSVSTWSISIHLSFTISKYNVNNTIKW